MTHHSLSYMYTEETTQSLKIVQHIDISRTKVLQVLRALSKSRYRKVRFLHINPAL